MERKRRRGIHPQLREGFMMLYNELREREGLSDAEACQRLMTDFDWGLNELTSTELPPRGDEYADTETLRNKEAENDEDLAAQWLAAYERGDGSHLILELIMGLRGTGS